MQFSFIPQYSKRKSADLLVIPFWEDEKKPKKASSSDLSTAAFKTVLNSGDFTGKEGDTPLIYIEKEKEKRAILLGLGRQQQASVETLRRAYASVIRIAQKKKLTRLNICIPTSSPISLLTEDEIYKGVVEGLLLANYQWTQLKNSTKNDQNPLVEDINLIGVNTENQERITHYQNSAEAVYLARDLINGNADDVTPQYLGNLAKELARTIPSIKATVMDKKQIEKEGMGLLLAVGQGSVLEPTFIILNYRGNPKSKDHTVLIGKGVTYDTGGLNIKPTGSMETMRDDMSGAAAVIGAIVGAATNQLEVNVTAVIAACENAIDGKSFKPGDVYKSYSGKTVEIANTDAEGRLTLADAISYSVDKLQPTRIINLATLTGAMIVALGEEISGLMSNDDDLANRLLNSSQKTFELIWRLPLHSSYKELLKSDVADIKNLGGRPAGSITAALFLQEFVQGTPWAHLDIAGTAFSNKEKGYIPKNGVGFGVRLLLDFLENVPH